MPPRTAIEDRQRAEDRRWGRMPGARPPLPAWLPLLVWVAGAVVLTAVVVGLVGGPGPLDDPRPERQRPGLLVDPADARSVSGLALPGAAIGRRPVFIAFARQAPTAGELRDGTDDVADGYAKVLVVAGATSAALRIAGVPVVADPGARITAKVGMARPEDGGPPIGYAIVDGSARVRYATLDPTWPRHGLEVRLITRAAR